MALLKVICWAIIFIARIRFPPGKPLATILHVNKCKKMKGRSLARDILEDKDNLLKL